MTPRQKAIVVTELLSLLSLAKERTLFHENEAGRYRRQQRIITEQIKRVRELPERSRKIIVDKPSK